MIHSLKQLLLNCPTRFETIQRIGIQHMKVQTKPQKYKITSLEQEKRAEKKNRQKNILSDSKIAKQKRQRIDLFFRKVQKQRAVECEIIQIRQKPSNQRQYFKAADRQTRFPENNLFVIANCKKAIEINPKCAEAYSILGYATCLSSGSLEQGLAWNQKALQLDKNNPCVNWYTGLVHRMFGSYITAIHFYKRALQFTPEPNKYKFLLALGMNYFDLGQYQLARKYISQALDKKFHPRQLYYFNLGIVFEKLDNLSKAKECYQKVLDIELQSPHVYHRLGLIAQKQDRLDSAIEHYAQTLKIHPQNSYVHQRLSVIHRKKGQTKLAISNLVQTIQLSLEQAQQFMESSHMYSHLSICKKTLQKRKDQIKQLYNNAEKHFLTGKTLVNSNKTDEAFHCLAFSLEQSQKIRIMFKFKSVLTLHHLFDQQLDVK